MQKHISEKRHAVNKPEQQQGTAICVIHRSFYTGITNLGGHTRDDAVLLQEAGGQGKEGPTFARATLTSNKEILSLGENNVLSQPVCACPHSQAPVILR